MGTVLPPLVESIAVGLVSSLLLAEILGLSAAGLVVPGYFAFHLDEPLILFVLSAATLLTYSSEKFISSNTVLFGRRLLSIDLLLSFVWVFLLEKFILFMAVPVPLVLEPIAYFVPALIVIFIGSSGFRNTVIGLFVNTVIVRLFMILLDRL